MLQGKDVKIRQIITAIRSKLEESFVIVRTASKAKFSSIDFSKIKEKLQKNDSVRQMIAVKVQRTVSAVRGYKPTRSHIFGASGMAAGLSFIIVISLLITNAQVVAVPIAGQPVGYINDETAFNAIVQQATEEISAQNSGTLTLIQEPDVALVAERTGTTDAAAINESVAVAGIPVNDDLITVSAFAINVDGQVFANVATSKDAHAVLRSIETKYAGLDDTWIGNFQETVAIENVIVELNALTSTPAAFDYLITGGVAEQSYEVQNGDTLSGIASKLSVSTDEIKANNPDINLTVLHIGDQITISSLVPYIHYETTGVVTEREPIEPPVIEEPTDTLYKNEKKVIQEGTAGEREVTRQKTFVNGQLTVAEELNSVTITEPVEKIVQVGTKARPVAVSYSGSFSGSGIVGTAYSLIGIPYRSGGSSPAAGFDCSGFTQYVYGLNGIGLPRTASGQTLAGSVISLGAAAPGDIVAWGSVGNSYHVGIYIGGGQYIHAPTPGRSIMVQSISNYSPSFAIRF
jgi:cell wall-associated NlpC family hydrolase